METPALTIPGLARLMLRTAEQAYDEDLRATGESDQAIFGKLSVLDAICDPLWVSDHTQKMSPSEEAVLGHARDKLSDAYDFLRDRIENSRPEVKRRKRAEALGINA